MDFNSRPRGPSAMAAAMRSQNPVARPQAGAVRPQISDPTGSEPLAKNPIIQQVAPGMNGPMMSKPFTAGPAQQPIPQGMTAPRGPSAMMAAMRAAAPAAPAMESMGAGGAAPPASMGEAMSGIPPSFGGAQNFGMTKPMQTMEQALPASQGRQQLANLLLRRGTR